jgi:hypothetical protein
MARYFWNALDRRNDVEVYAVGPFFDAFIPWSNGLQLPQKYVKVPYLPLPQNTAQLKVPYQAVVNQMPDDLDLFLSIDAGWHFVTRPNAKVVALIETDPHVLKSHYECPKAYSDFTFCMQTPYMQSNEQYLAYAYDPEYHYQEPETEKIYDACLIGLHYNSRSALVSALQSKGYKVHYSIGNVYDEYRHIYNQSKIALSWSSLQDMPARVWEALAMGNLLVRNRVPDLQTFFVEDNHYLGFDTVEEAVYKVDWALDNWDDAQRIANAGHRKVKAHTYDRRIEQILKTCKLI